MNTDLILGDGFYEHVISHEIGHSLEVHPFDGFIVNNALDRTVDTVMSYDEDYFYPLDPMPIDIAAIGFLYGQSNPNLQDDDYYWSNYELNNYRFSITDAGGNDSIILDNWNTGIAVNLEPN